MLISVSQLAPVSVPLPPLQVSVPLPPLSASAPVPPKSYVVSRTAADDIVALEPIDSIVPGEPMDDIGSRGARERLSFPTVPSILAICPLHRTGGPLSKAPMSQAAPCGRVTPR